MTNANLWLLLAGIAVAAELAIGTFYLLMIALGLIAGALAAYFGLAAAAQLVLAAITGGLGVVLLRWWRGKQKPVSDISFDVGELIEVTHWSPERTAQVKYRGSFWLATLADPQLTALPGVFRLKEVAGSRLVLEPKVDPRSF